MNVLILICLVLALFCFVLAFAFPAWGRLGWLGLALVTSAQVVGRWPA